ncbi:MAG: hypothetical protein KF773_21345 [Deltaproteobacteria bacterium]|nr:hypothetical protein [Deltaproteobacteria bacterium]
MKKLRLPLVLAGMLAAAALAVTACKQGLGDRCQTANDCEDGLVCNQATKVCATGLNSNLDAEPPPDAPPADAPIDAAPDAPDLPPP